MTVKILAKFSAAGLALLLAGGAQASVLTYHFTATVDSITAYCGGCGIDQSSLSNYSITGADIHVGGTVSGTIRYDNATGVLSETSFPSSNFLRKYYDVAPSEALTYRFDGGTYTFETQENNAKEVVENSAGYQFNDYFAGYQDPEEPHDSSRSAALYFGAARAGGPLEASLPPALDPARFSTMFLDSYFGVYETSIYVRSQITSLTGEVPEPGALALLAAGAAGMGAMRRRRRRGALN